MLVDLLATIFAMISAIWTIRYKNSGGWIYIINNEYHDLGAFITLTILLLELKILFNLHVYELFGIQFAIIFGVFREVLPFLFVLLIFVLVFGSSLHILSKLNTNSSNSNAWNLISFIVAPYYIVTGSSDIISPYITEKIITKDNIALIFILILISFFITIYMMNLFIGILSNKISDLHNKASFLNYKAMALSIIEKSYMLPNQRQRKDLFPEIIFFEAHIVELRKIVKQIQNNDWPGTYKPYISDTLLKAIRMSNENSNEDKNDDEYDEWNFYQ
ncbi:hypothetical protein C2G38_2146675 [Gigaspora rosea]|uniref:Ion transport domain-containing protein n=1 Tax=Gigaspora rosea TaxID=44941 RepID=A0A397UGB8_9GLOM|nr:hypothetical protein C2G38_2146675 [Gigaspora rosea]